MEFDCATCNLRCDKCSMDANQSDLQGIVFVSMDGMQAMYIAGELVMQQPQLSIEAVLEELGVAFVSHFLSSPCNPVVRRGVFPVNLKRVILEGDMYFSKGINGDSRG